VKFFIKSVSVALLAGILMHIFFYNYTAAWADIGVATGLALFFVLSGYFSYSYALRLKRSAFFTIIFSTMFVRMVIMLVFIVFWIRYQSHNTKVFLLSLMLWYVLLIIPEIMSFNRMRVEETY
jgi:hypothetical protein